MTAAPARAIAFYLPQFHPIPENDEWWGKGFTEWTNVAKAKPLYPGHAQPDLPADLGFYDLRVPEVREAQADLARNAGIEGFCYWHYWFGEHRRILERPFDEMLASGRPDFPFCLAWANQPWTGIWHGLGNRTLVQQTYPGRADEKAHFDLVLPAFRDRRYLKVDGKPIFVVLDPSHLQDTVGFVSRWRNLAAAAGLPGIYFVGMSNAYAPELLAPFDALIEFGPGDFLARLPRNTVDRVLGRLKRRDVSGLLKGPFWERLRRPARYSYRQVVDTVAAFQFPDSRYLPCVLSNWDNTPRSGRRGIVFEHATADLFERYLRRAVKAVEQRPAQERLVFIKAWNEWAEGNYLEPSERSGHSLLTAVRKVLCPGSEAQS